MQSILSAFRSWTSIRLLSLLVFVLSLSVLPMSCASGTRVDPLELSAPSAVLDLGPRTVLKSPAATERRDLSIPVELLDVSTSAPKRRDSGAPGRSAFHVLLGARGMDNEAWWQPLENHGVFGLQLAGNTFGGPFGLEGGLLVSASQETVVIGSSAVDIEATLAEIFGGLRVALAPADSSFAVYFGVGVSALFASVDYQSGSTIFNVDGSTAGYYAHVGADVFITDSITLGIDIRTLRGTDLELEGDGFLVTNGDADYDQVALSFGVWF